jgi:hypothetical protein
MIVAHQSRSTPTSMRRRIVVRPDAPAATFRIGGVKRLTRGARGAVEEGQHGKWRALRPPNR